MAKMTHGLTHLDSEARPQMVDVSQKQISTREAVAAGEVHFPAEAWQQLEQTGFATRKGPITDVARIAGTMAVKKTAEWIPFCHSLPLDGCSFEIEPHPTEKLLSIRCKVTTTARTGVEMEALTGVTAAALTIYDMTKSLSHGITLQGIRLISKTGGKADFVVQL